MDVLWSVSEIATRDGISKQAVSRHIARLVERHGLTVERDSQGRVSRANVVEYDRLRNRHADLSKTQAPIRAASATLETVSESARSSTDPVYTREQARSMAYKAELLRLELQEKEGKIVYVEIVRASAVRAGEEIVRIIDRLPQAADELSVALGKSGSHGVRLALKRIGLAMRKDIADALAQTTAECLRTASREVVPGSEAAPDHSDPFSLI